MVTSEVSEKSSYPRLEIGDKHHSVWLVREPGKGTCINAGESPVHKVGDYRKDLEKLGPYTLFKGSVVLENV
jgi:hypothetical protein